MRRQQVLAGAHRDGSEIVQKRVLQTVCGSAARQRTVERRCPEEQNSGHAEPEQRLRTAPGVRNQDGREPDRERQHREDAVRPHGASIEQERQAGPCDSGPPAPARPQEQCRHQEQ